MPRNNDRPEGYLLSKSHSYYIFSLLFLLYMFDYIDRLVVVSLFPYLIRIGDLRIRNAGCWSLRFTGRSYSFPFRFRNG